jgi:hypothetical protein
MAIKCVYQIDRKNLRRFPFQGLPKYSQIPIFGMKIYHLATLMGTTMCDQKFPNLA